ncbi:MAG: class I SAM-dependent DNA methyltransferase [Armatimonadota bacterium]
MQDNAKRDFNKEAKSWDDNPMRVQMAQRVADAIVQQLPVSNEMDMLDYGAGTGLVTLALQPLVRSVTAADSSDGMLARLSEKAEASGLSNVKTKLLDLEKEAVPVDRYELIISSMTMHHLQDHRALISNLSTMLKSGGYLAIADLDLDDGEFHTDQTGVMHDGFDRHQIVRLFAESGLEQVTATTANTITREVAGKGLREFTIFLVTGRKA